MSVTPQVLAPGGFLTTAPVTLYTAPANTTVLVTSAVFTNTDTVARLLTVYLVRAGGTAGTVNVLIDGRSIASKGSDEASELFVQILGPGDFIAAKADTGAVVNTTGISGYLFQ